MVRPTKADRTSIAITTVRVSNKTLQLLKELQTRHNFATIDQTLRYYLGPDVTDSRPIFHTANEIYQMTKHQPIDRIIKDAAKRYSSNKPFSSTRRDHTAWRKRKPW
jgi:hypothetical protein